MKTSDAHIKYRSGEGRFPFTNFFLQVLGAVISQRQLTAHESRGREIAPRCDHWLTCKVDSGQEGGRLSWNFFEAHFDINHHVF